MCNSPLGFIYVFGAFIVVLYFFILHKLKKDKPDSNKKSDSDHSPTTNKLSRIKPLNESDSKSKSTNSEKTEPEIIIAPREERLTKEQIIELNKDNKSTNNVEKANAKTNKPESNKSDRQHSPEKKKLDSYSIAFIFAAIGRIAALVSFIFVNINRLELKYFIGTIVAFLIPVIGGLAGFAYWGYIIIATFIKPFLSLHLYILSLICLIISIIGFVGYVYNKVYDDTPRYKQKAINAATFTLIPLVIIAIVFSIVQINYLNSPDSHIHSNETSNSSTIKLTSISSNVSPGDTAHISVTAKPNTEYSISVEYSSGYSEAEGLENKTTDSAGRVSWSWKVGTNTYSGEYPITITNHETLMEYETFYFTVK